MDEDEVIFAVEGQKFIMRKSVLCEESDYFRAMFSGNFKEFNEQEIALDIVDVPSMKIIIKYLRNGMDVTDFSEYPLYIVGKLAQVTNMLQFIQLSKIIKSYLELQAITVQNWLEIMKIAENNNYTKLKNDCIDFGVPTLKEMKPQYVPTIHELVWYLSQSRLYVLNEYEVFKYALDWMSYSKTEVSPTALLMFFGCLDITRITNTDIIEIKALCLSLFGLGFSQSLAGEVVNCLTELSNCACVVTTDEIITQASHIKDKYSDAVYLEVLELAKSSRSRQVQQYFPVVSILKTNKESSTRYSDAQGQSQTDEQISSTDAIRYQTMSDTSTGRQHSVYFEPPLSHALANHAPWHFHNQLMRTFFSDAGYNLYTFKDANLDKWLEMRIPNQNKYSWSITAWGLRKLVLVISTSKGQTSTKIKVYNVPKKEWMKPNVLTTTGMVRRSAVVGDFLYLLCFEENIVVNLMNNSHKRIAKLPFKTINHPEVETRMPLTCVHNDELYVSNLSSIHRYDETNDVWIKVIDYHISNMVSNDNGYMYVTDAVSNSLCRFRPGIDVTMEMILCCADNFDPIINVCAMDDRLLFFTNRTRSPEDITGGNDFERTLSIHEYNLKASLGSNAENSSLNLNEVWCQESTHIKFDPYRNVLKLLLEEPYVDELLTTYLEEKLRVWKE